MFRQMTKEKESGMEKLIELLNEYDNEEFGEALYMENKVYANDFLIISKKFGFIQWLVENEKIDTCTRNPLFITELVGEQEKQMPYSFYEEMLIRLTLSDTPIEDLISYLK